MFEAISVLPNSSQGNPLDIGDLTEKMLYYGEVNLFTGKEEFITLFEYFDLDTLVEYLKLGYLKIHNRKKHYGAGLMHGSYIADFLYDTNYDLKKIIQESYFDYSGNIERSRKAAGILYKYVGIYETPKNFAEEINKDLIEVIGKKIAHYHPQDQIDLSKFQFDVTPQHDGTLKVQSNLDTSRYPFLDTSSILLNIGTAIDDIKIAANYQSELSVPHLNSKIISVKLNSIVEKVIKSQKDIEIFQYTEFQDAPSLKQVINGKHRTTKEFLEVLKAGKKFKIWLKDLPEDGKLLKEYHDKLNEKSWMQKVPSKAIRFYLVQTLGMVIKTIVGGPIGLLAGIGLSASNTFLAEKLFKGWKPNQFINDEVIPFVQIDP